jgi:hypothetical protein
MITDAIWMGFSEFILECVGSLIGEHPAWGSKEERNPQPKPSVDIPAHVTINGLSIFCLPSFVYRAIGAAL